MRLPLPRIAYWLVLIFCGIKLGACEPGDQSSGSGSPSASTSGPNSDGAETAGASTRATTTNAGETGRNTIEADLVLTGGTLIDGTGGAVLEDAAAAIKDGRKPAVGRAAGLDISEGSRTLDVSGKTILPGFINTHVHSRYITLDETKTWTREGVTTVRDRRLPGRYGDSQARDTGRRRYSISRTCSVATAQALGEIARYSF